MEELDGARRMDRGRRTAICNGRIAMPSGHLALLRGVNVGGKNKVPMKDLVEIFQACGCERVRSYIQSGNIIFDAVPAVMAGLPARVAAGVGERFGFNIPVILRPRPPSSPPWSRIIPTSPRGPIPPICTSAFSPIGPSRTGSASSTRTARPPTASSCSAARSTCTCPTGWRATRLTNAYFDSRLATTSTGRNWRSATRLLEMMIDRTSPVTRDRRPFKSIILSYLKIHPAT